MALPCLMGRRSSDLQRETLAAGSAAAMHYVPSMHGSYAAMATVPEQMTTSLNLDQEVASSRQCQVPWASNCMHPSMSLEAQTHRSMPANWGTRYVPQPSHLSCDDSSESNGMRVRTATQTATGIAKKKRRAQIPVESANDMPLFVSLPLDSGRRDELAPPHSS